MSESDYILRILERERLARKEAERILEEKSMQLYAANKQLLELNVNLESEVANRTEEIKSEVTKFKEFLNGTPLPLIVCSLLNFEILEYNQKAQEKYSFQGRPKKYSLADLHLAGDKSRIVETLNTGDFKNYENSEWKQVNQKTKEEFWVKLHLNKLDYKEGPVLVIMMEDLSVINKIKKEKEIHEKLYQELVENVSDIVFRSDLSGRFTYVNKKASTLTGYSEEELLGMVYLDLIAVDSKSVVKNHFKRQLLDNEQTTYIEFPILTKENKIVWIGQQLDLPGDTQNEVVGIARDITERKLIENELIRSEEKYRSIIENLDLGILEVDNDDRISKAYPRFLKMTGYKENEILGKKAIETLLSAEMMAVMQVQNENRIKGEADVYEVKMRCKDGSEIWVLISGAPFYDLQGNIIGSIGLHLDITDRKIIEVELREAKIKAEEAVGAREMFMANMSHEIRTPMNAIIGMGELLGNTSLNVRQQGYAEAIRSSADNLLIIINDILDFSKLESGHVELENIAFSLPKVIVDVKTIYGLKVEQKNVDVKCLIDFDIKAYVGDPFRINQILVNLFGNAVKFTDSGEIVFEVSIIDTNDGFDLIRFSVIDSGIGISLEAQEKIFESFKQADISTSRKYGGTGLGLAISSKLAKLLGGTLTCESELGVGTKFSFDLWLMRTEAENILSIESIDLDNNTLKDTRILLVEDNELNRYLAATILEGWGCDVSMASNGEEAVSMAISNEYDIVLMDIRMPVMDGIAATKILRETHNYKKVIVALTANASRADTEKYLSTGMDAHISKPFKQPELFSVISGLLNQSQLKSLVIKQDLENNSNSVLDLSGLKLSTNGNVSFMNKMIEIFLDNIDKDLNLIKKGIEDNDIDRLSDIAHKLKPSIDSMCSSNVRSLIRRVEEKNTKTCVKLSKELVENIEVLVERLKNR